MRPIIFFNGKHFSVLPIFLSFGEWSRRQCPPNKRQKYGQKNGGQKNKQFPVLPPGSGVIISLFGCGSALGAKQFNFTCNYSGLFRWQKHLGQNYVTIQAVLKKGKTIQGKTIKRIII